MGSNTVYQRAEALLREARRVPGLIAAATPVNFREEVQRIASLAGRRERTTARFAYRAVAPRREIVGDLERFATEIDQAPPDDIAPLLAGRVREIALELRAADAVGTSAITELGKRRFGDVSAEADALADAWATAHASGFADANDEATIDSSDIDDPRSLIRRMRDEADRVVPDFRVEVTPHLLPLAATGEGIILVAEGRAVSSADVERTVFHEVHGHARPQVKSAVAPHPIFRLGTARGSDHQEGYALVLEEEAGHLVAPRRAELALRHLAAAIVLGGGAVADTVDVLLDRGASPAIAARIACRAHRGACAGAGGIGREAVYLPSYVRARAIAGTLDFVALAHGRISVDAASRVVPLLGPNPSQSVLPPLA